MTARAWPGAGGRRPRLGVGAVACVLAVSVHVAGWLALKSMPTTGRAVQPHAAETARRALIVEWIAQRPAADARSAARLPRRHEPNVSAVRRPAPSTGTQNRSPNSEAVTKADAAANRVEAVRPNEPAAGVDWRHDLDAIGTPRSVGRSPAAAALGALGALGASSGGIAQRRDTVDATLARGVSEARRADCRNAYAGMGLLAIPALALDTVRDAGCKW